VKLLVIDTASSAAVAVAAHLDGIDAVESHPAPMDHASRLVPLIAEVIGSAPLGAVAVITGPGSFAGLRVGLATAKAIARAAGIPLYGVSTLQAIAAASSRARGLAVPPMGRDRFARARFEAGRLLTEPESGPFVPGEDASGEPADGPRAELITPSDRALAALHHVLAGIASGTLVPGAEPVYLRGPGVTPPRTNT
jgi:tRNA threonylcarbamoyl adenosine modification protein YeaZ